ncbi:hypothetical protein MOUN0_H06282 [Monosporozyma unispora]
MHNPVPSQCTFTFQGQPVDWVYIQDSKVGTQCPPVISYVTNIGVTAPTVISTFLTVNSSSNYFFNVNIPQTDYIIAGPPITLS